MGLSQSRQSSTNCFNVNPSKGLQFFVNCSSMGPFTTGPQVLSGPCCSTGSPWGHSLLRASPCSSVGSSMGNRWISAPWWTSMGCRDTACLTTVFSTGCRGTSAAVPGAPPPFPSALSLVSAEWFLSYSVTQVL